MRPHPGIQRPELLQHQLISLQSCGAGSAWISISKAGSALILQLAMFFSANTFLNAIFLPLQENKK
jgi:hypothetical protein